MIKVALIDSGIDKNFKGIDKFEGIHIGIDRNGEIYIDNNFYDRCGHGTACASVIIKECRNVSFYIVKIFENELTTKFEVLRFALECLLYVDVDIINLSLTVAISEDRYNEIKGLANKLIAQNKQIFWAIENGKKENLFSKDSVIWNVGIDDSVEKMYVKKSINSIYLNSLPYLHYTGNGEYKLFGSSTSYATARATGIMAYYIEKLKDIDLARSKFVDDFSVKKNFQPLVYKDENINYNTVLFMELVDIVGNFFGINECETILNFSLFSSRMGKHEDFCYSLIREIEQKMNISFYPNYYDISKADFISIYSLYKLINEKTNMNKRNEDEPCVNI